MDTQRECGCKGRRTCIWCEEHYDLKPDFAFNESMKLKSFFYCYQCERAWKGWDSSVINGHPNHDGESIPFPGIFIQQNFLSTEEAETLMNGIDNEKWDISQSGRRKQNYGPKCNFKRRKLVKGDFKGFPEFTLFVQKKMKEVSLLDQFYVIEQCSLEYDPLKGACIDPHIDDCWIWGERIVTVNILGDSVLSMRPYRGPTKRYNLDLIYNQGTFDQDAPEDLIVRIPMPSKSLLVLYGKARYDWEHYVFREDIITRRVCLAYREFTPPYLPGGHHEELGKDILKVSKDCLLDK